MPQRSDDTLPLIPFRAVCVAPAVPVPLGIVYCTHQLQTGQMYYTTVYSDTPINLDVPEIAEQQLTAAWHSSNTAVDYVVQCTLLVRIL